MNNLLSYCGLVDARIRASNKDLPVHRQVNSDSYHCGRYVSFMMHPSKPFTRDHAAIIVNASVFVVDNPAIAAIEISIVLVVFISVLIFTDQFSFFEIISPVIKYQNEFQLRSHHYLCTYLILIAQTRIQGKPTGTVGVIPFYVGCSDF